MNKYKYKRPKGKLYKIPVRKWNKVFANRGRLQTCEIYIQEDMAIIHFMPSFLFLLSVTIMIIPLYLLGVFLQGHKETVNDIKGLYFCRKLGQFSSDACYKKYAGSWDKLQKLIGEK